MSSVMSCPVSGVKCRVWSVKLGSREDVVVEILYSGL